MKIPDYLHSDLLQNATNDLVFQKTYETIDKLAKKITYAEMYKSGLDYKADKKIRQDLEKHNAKLIADNIIRLLNYTIHNFEK